MSCEKKAYVKFPFIIGYDCAEGESGCDCHENGGNGQIPSECCEALLAGQNNIIKLLADIKKCVCDCGGVIPEPEYNGEAIGVILPESGRQVDKSLFRVDKDIENVDPVSADYFNQHPLWSGIVREEIDGQTMVKIPAFAYKRGEALAGSNAGKKYLLLAPADTTEPGFERHPAFMKDGQPIDYFWVGAYQACADPADTTKLGSVPGTMPFVSANNSTMITKAKARNNGSVSGFMMCSIYQWAAIQMLYLVEYADPDSQAVIGNGNSSNSSGTVKKVDELTVATSYYRGIIGLWGNIWQRLDGIRTDANKKTEIWRRDGTQSYVATPFVMPSVTWMYISQMETSNGSGYDFNDVWLPAKTSDNVSDPNYADAFCGLVANADCYMGGSCKSNSYNGIFCTHLYQPLSYSDSTVGTRLAKI